MKKFFGLFILIVVFVIGSFVYKQTSQTQPYGAPPYIEDGINFIQDEQYPNLSNWKRPEGPIKVGLQVGHWKNSELPDELIRIRESGGGTSNGQIPEWEVVLKIAQETKTILEKEGFVVDLIPATVPVEYYADAFVAIHADGSIDSSKLGFKVAAPRRDYSGKANQLSKIIEKNYEVETDLPLDPNITRNMTGYYAFNWRRYDHAIHPMTPAVILETGFLTNPFDARMLINNPEIPAQALAKGLIEFLN